LQRAAAKLYLLAVSGPNWPASREATSAVLV